MLLLRLSMRCIAPVVATLAAALPSAAAGETGGIQSSQVPARIVVSGMVPDEATKLKVIAGVRGIYGEQSIIDQILVGGVQAPRNWTSNVEALIGPQLKSISKGTLAIEGTAVSIRGEVSDASTRQAIEKQMTAKLQHGYAFTNGLRVSATSQAVLDRALDSRVIEFEHGSAMLTPAGMRIIDEMADAMRRMSGAKVEVIGHTDSVGNPASNLALSRARADSVKTYLVKKGIATELISTSGMGADHPIANNATEEGRKRNRRIEFRAAQ